jgi:hypothetical protein
MKTPKPSLFLVIALTSFLLAVVFAWLCFDSAPFGSAIFYREPPISETFPGTMLCLPRYPKRGWIDDIQGLDSGWPCRSLYPETGDGGPGRSSFPRMKTLPPTLVIVWSVVKDGLDEDDVELEPWMRKPGTTTQYRQQIQLPRSLKGMKGSILWLLDENNVWHLSLRDENDWEKVIMEW